MLSYGGAVMAHRITTQDDREIDGNLTPELHKTLVERLARETEEDQAFYAQIMNLAASTTDGESIEKVVRDFVNTLPEPQRTMLNERRKGRSPTEIAEAMGMQVRPVCQALAKIYADLRRFIREPFG
jgi:DNA-directed RNA polymerase specialized sigma24 family protein